MSVSIQSFFPSITKKKYNIPREKEALELSILQEDLLAKEELKTLAKKKKTLQ